MRRRVVITGIGPVTSLGIGKKDFTENVYGLNTCIAAVKPEFENNYTFKSRFYVPKPQYSLTDYGFHHANESLMEEGSRLAVLGAKLALEDAGITLKCGSKYWQTEGLNNCGVIIGTGMSSLQTAFDSYLAHVSKEEADPQTQTHTQTQTKNQPKAKRKPRFNRMVIPMLMTNSPVAWISIQFGLQGYSFALNASCASGTVAIGEAYQSILSGRCETMLTGGVEALTEKYGGIMRGFDMLATLTRAADGRPQPFSKTRSGFLFNEGAACILVLEELTHALERGAEIYAEIVGYEATSEAYNIVQMEPSGEGIKAMMRKLIAEHKIDYLNAHGTATQSNDEIEGRVIRAVFGSKPDQPVINASKGILGHSIGASGALEGALTAIAIKESRIHANLTSEPLEYLQLNLETVEHSVNYAVSASYGFGGHNAMLLFKRYTHDG